MWHCSVLDQKCGVRSGWLEAGYIAYAYTALNVVITTACRNRIEWKNDYDKRFIFVNSAIQPVMKGLHSGGML
jgi:hypothetical protein